MNTCKICKKEISKPSKHCKKCAKIGSRNPMYGKKLTKQQIEKLKEIHIGSKNKMWRGDKVGYYSLHEYVKNYFKKPKKCMECGKKTIFLDLANKGIYNRDIINWEYLCRRCHMKKDGRLIKFNPNTKI